MGFFVVLGFSQWCVELMSLVELINLEIVLLDGLVLEKIVCLGVSELMLMCLATVTTCFLLRQECLFFMIIRLFPTQALTIFIIGFRVRLTDIISAKVVRFFNLLKTKVRLVLVILHI